MYCTYPAIVHKGTDGGFWAEFVDFNAFSQGATLDELMGNAAEAMACHIEDELQSGAALPAPSDISQIHTDGDDFTTLVRARANVPDAVRKSPAQMVLAVS
ncbi:MAG: type II toxin-antitoxin system HicB family antitoxin [Schwartzia sp.]|nr:type II toxin-antitoxin system HicB family antitoxin [Schwartzia sp. (in: firmicutes)]